MHIRGKGVLAPARLQPWRGVSSLATGMMEEALAGYKYMYHMQLLCLVPSRENYYDPFGSSDDDEELVTFALEQQKRRAWITDPGDIVSPCFFLCAYKACV